MSEIASQQNNFSSKNYIIARSSRNVHMMTTLIVSVCLSVHVST